MKVPRSPGVFVIYVCVSPSCCCGRSGGPEPAGAHGADVLLEAATAGFRLLGSASSQLVVLSRILLLDGCFVLWLFSLKMVLMKWRFTADERDKNKTLLAELAL